tara:strand:+ start:4186 stop:4572 length:387 start_codon:yes stop_codon:yes gene_type:complete
LDALASDLQHPCFFLSQLATFLPVFVQQASPLEHFFDADFPALSLEQLSFFAEQHAFEAVLSALASLLQAFVDFSEEHFLTSSEEHFFTVCSTFTFSTLSVVVCATSVLHKNPTNIININFFICLSLF